MAADPIKSGKLFFVELDSLLTPKVEPYSKPEKEAKPTEKPAAVAQANTHSEDTFTLIGADDGYRTFKSIIS